MKKTFGGDMSKWFITRSRSHIGKWHVCPPLRRDIDGKPLHGWWAAGRTFDTGAEALAAFATGAAHMASTVSLWDRDFNLVVTQGGCDNPKRYRDGTFSVQVRGVKLQDVVKPALATDPDSVVRFITIDQKGYAGSRLSGRITGLKIDTHDCECGASTIYTTTVSGWRFDTAAETLADFVTWPSLTWESR